MSKLLRSAIVLALLGSSAAVAHAEVTLQDRQQAACYNDVQKLCGQFVPDVQKTETCMSTMKDRVSAGCRKYYED